MRYLHVPSPWQFESDAIRKVIDGILDHTIRSGIEEQPYGDRVTVEQYFEALRNSQA